MEDTKKFYYASLIFDDVIQLQNKRSKKTMDFCGTEPRAKAVYGSYYAFEVC